MVTAKGSTPRAQRLHIRAVLRPLISSMRGQIFLLNLREAMRMLPSAHLRTALLSVERKDATRMHDEDYLPHLKQVLQDSAFGLSLACPVASFIDFAPDDWVVNVLPFSSYRAYYEDPVTALTGHSSFGTRPGSTTSAFSPVAQTAPICWLAGRASLLPATIAKSDAEGARDVLGLVHYGARTKLVAMHLKLRSPSVYRPTVVEANPNARFRQTDPLNPSENRWGKTINLHRLEFSSPGGDIGGVSELASSKIALNSCINVEFYNLGQTATDRSTTTMDKKFLDNLLRGRDVTKILDEIVDGLM